MRFCGTQKIKTNRLLLRRVELSDVPEMYENWQSDDRVTKYLSWEAYPNIEHSYKIVNNWISMYSKSDFFLWLVVEKETKVPIGTIGVGDYGEHWEYAEVGYCFGFDWWNLGYATEALKAVINFLLYKVGIPEVICCCDRENKASSRVMQKAGMDFKCTKRDYPIKYDYICDVLIFTIKRQSLFDRIKGKGS